jgi:hypothetical protein
VSAGDCHGECDGFLTVEAIVWRQPTKGAVPSNAAPPEGGTTNVALVPDFVSALARDGLTIAGYIPKSYLFGGPTFRPGSPANPPQDPPMPVYGEDLITLVGYMVPGVGFVPLGTASPGGSALPIASVAPSTWPVSPEPLPPATSGTLSPEFGPATWALDPAFPAPGPTTTELFILVWERACSSGSPTSGRMSAPIIETAQTTVTITIGVRPRSGFATCQLPPGTAAVVTLPEPLGFRTLLDGGVVPGAPPTPMIQQP